eukprot:jgi/Bigna1/80528/fgenesh1_pg.72_\
MGGRVVVVPPVCHQHKKNRERQERGCLGGGRKKAWEEAMEAAIRLGTAKSFSIGLEACARSRKWPKVRGLWERMGEEHKDTFAYTAMISAATRCGRWEKAIAVFEEMQAAKDVMVDEVAYNAAIFAFGVGKQPLRALEMLIRMQQHNLKMDRTSFNTVISACAKDPKHWSLALDCLNAMINDEVMRLWKEIDARGLKKDVFTYTAAFKADIPETEEDAIGIFRSIESPDTICVNALLDYLARRGQWESSLSLIEKISLSSASHSHIDKGGGGEEEGIGHPDNIKEDPKHQNHRLAEQLDDFTFSSILKGMNVGRAWQQALDMLKGGGRIGAAARGNAPFNCGITACHIGRTWENAIYLLETMKDRNISRDVATMRALFP